MRNLISGETPKSDPGTGCRAFRLPPPGQHPSTFDEDLATYFQKTVAVRVSDIYTCFINRPNEFNPDPEKVFQPSDDRVLRPQVTMLPWSDTAGVHRRLETVETTVKPVLGTN